MSRFMLACCCAFLVGLAPAAAQTTPSPAPAPAAAVATPSPEALQIVAAMNKATSYRIQLSSTNGLAGTVTVLGPQNRKKALMAVGAMIMEFVTADGRAYLRMNGADWRVVDVPAQAGLVDALKSLNDPSKIHVLADRVESGVTVGAYGLTATIPPGMPLGTGQITLGCTYDKKTYLPRTCATNTMTQTFEGWNDPANVVDIPVVASPAPAASPHP